MARRWGVAAALCVAAAVGTQGEAMATPVPRSGAAQPDILSAALAAATSGARPAAASPRGTPVWVRHFATYTECLYWMSVYNQAGYVAYCAIWPDGIQADFYVVT